MNDKSHLLRFGYAPGNYWFVCRDCGNKHAVGDKRSTRCEACAESLHAQITSVEAVADKHRAMTTLPEEAVKSADIIQVITDLRLAILQDDDEGLAEHAEPMVQAKELIAKLSASPFLSVQGVVKKLEWGNARITEDGREAEDAESPVGRYIATDTGWFLLGRTGYEVERGLYQSKAAAQADFEARILSALEPSAARSLALEEEFATIRAMIYCYEGDSAQAFDAQKALANIWNAIRALSSPDHADAGKVEGDGRAYLERFWRPISEADKSITFDHTFDLGDGEKMTIRNSDHYWVRDADGRVYEATWSDHKGGYWWDLEGESPVDPVEYMPHPLSLPSAPSEGAE